MTSQKTTITAQHKSKLNTIMLLSCSWWVLLYLYKMTKKVWLSTFSSYYSKIKLIDVFCWTRRYLFPSCLPDALENTNAILDQFLNHSNKLDISATVVMSQSFSPSYLLSICRYIILNFLTLWQLLSCLPPELCCVGRTLAAGFDLLDNRPLGVDPDQK